jgi:hypothetical protein
VIVHQDARVLYPPLWGMRAWICTSGAATHQEIAARLIQCVELGTRSLGGAGISGYFELIGVLIEFDAESMAVSHWLPTSPWTRKAVEG